MRNFLSAALLGLCMAVASVQAADPLNRETVQQNLDKIAERKLPEADQKALQQGVGQTPGPGGHQGGN